MTRSVTHLFEDYGQAKNAVAALERAGFHPQKSASSVAIAMMVPWQKMQAEPRKGRRSVPWPVVALAS